MKWLTHIAYLLTGGYIVTKAMDRATEAMKKDIERMKAERRERETLPKRGAEKGRTP